jgi:uncharacterized membrane protein YpjA
MFPAIYAYTWFLHHQTQSELNPFKAACWLYVSDYPMEACLTLALVCTVSYGLWYCLALLVAHAHGCNKRERMWSHYILGVHGAMCFLTCVLMFAPSAHCAGPDEIPGLHTGVKKPSTFMQCKRYLVPNPNPGVPRLLK